MDVHGIDFCNFGEPNFIDLWSSSLGISGLFADGDVELIDISI